MTSSRLRGQGRSDRGQAWLAWGLLKSRLKVSVSSSRAISEMTAEPIMYQATEDPLPVHDSKAVVMMTGTIGFGMVLAPLPMLLAIALTAFEFLVAFLQAYVFTILTCVYLNDALHPGH